MFNQSLFPGQSKWNLDQRFIHITMAFTSSSGFIVWGFLCKKTFLSFHISQVSTIKHDFLLCHYHMDFAWAVLYEHFSQKCENDLVYQHIRFLPVLEPAFMLSRILFIFCSKMGILERHEVYFLCFFFPRNILNYLGVFLFQLIWRRSFLFRVLATAVKVLPILCCFVCLQIR